MIERLVITFLTTLLVLGVIGYYERKGSKLVKNNTELNAKYADLVKKNEQTSFYLYKIKKENATIKEKANQMIKKCSYIINTCDDIIKNKKNCGYAGDYLRRSL
jgi:outer membrane murein-binding lipoprotein Lpp